jgi:hypothetical protein
MVAGITTGREASMTHQQRARELYYQLNVKQVYPSDPLDEKEAGIARLAEALAQVERETWEQAADKAKNLAACDYAQAHNNFRQGAAEMFQWCYEQAQAVTL